MIDVMGYLIVIGLLALFAWCTAVLSYVGLLFVRDELRYRRRTRS